MNTNRGPPIAPNISMDTACSLGIPKDPNYGKFGIIFTENSTFHRCKAHCERSLSLWFWLGIHVDLQKIFKRFFPQTTSKTSVKILTLMKEKHIEDDKQLYF